MPLLTGAEKLVAKSDSGTGVRSVQNALNVLEAVALSDGDVGVTQLADRLGLTKGSVHRHLTTLVDRGYLVQNSSTARYGVGPKYALLSRVVPRVDLTQIADHAMHDLRDNLGHTVVLSAMTPRGALVLSTVASTSPIEIGVRPGSELSFYASAQGRALLAFAPKPFQARILSRPLRAFTSKTITDRSAIERELVKVQRAGYAAAPEQVLLGVNAIAAPIYDDRDSCVAAIAIVGSIQHLPGSVHEQTASALKRAGRQISKLLGQAALSGRSSHVGIARGKSTAV
jgi:DNA-binding IclR family transcriptional regulator